MDQRLTSEFFYGSALAALCGLLFGLLLHIAWAKHPGGPQILFSSARAAEIHPDAGGPAAATDGPSELADLDTGPVPQEPLPVVRLHPEWFDVQPAAAGETERENADDLIADAPLAPSRELD